MVDSRKLHAEALRKSKRNKNKVPPSYGPSTRSCDPICDPSNARKTNLSVSGARKRKQSKTSAPENEVEAEPIRKPKGRKAPAAKATKSAASKATKAKAGEPPEAVGACLTKRQKATKERADQILLRLKSMSSLDDKPSTEPPDSHGSLFAPPVSEATDSAKKGAVDRPLKPSNRKSPPESFVLPTSTIIPTTTSDPINRLHENYIEKQATRIKKQKEVTAAKEEVVDYDCYNNFSEEESVDSSFSDLSQNKSPAKCKTSKGKLKGNALNDPPYNPFQERASLPMFGKIMSSKMSSLQYLPRSSRPFSRTANPSTTTLMSIVNLLFQNMVSICCPGMIVVRNISIVIGCPER